MCSLKALRDWCRDVCEGYSDVQFTDMSSSFTDGLAFCAIIHKHRPELLDFHSLSKHNVYKNMRLAFDVAERELGIPALLDPDELLCEEEPDLLSIVTYVSQLYCVFNGKSHDSLKNCVEAEPSSTRTQEQTHTPVYARLSPRKRAGPQEPPSPTPRSQDHRPENDSLKNCVEAEPSSTRTQEQTHTPVYARLSPRKRAEPQEPPSPTPRSQDHRPDNVPSQSAVRKDHPWMKLVDPGPWYRLPPAPAPSTHSHRCPMTFNPFLEDDGDESKDEELNRFSCKTSVAHKPQTSCSAPSMHQAAHGFPLIKRKVITDTHVSEKEVCKEQKELEESLLRLEKRGVQLEREMRTRTDDNLLVDWFILIHKKNMLVRRDAELMYMLRQRRLEQQQADVEFELRCLFNKPEQDWSSDDRQQEHQLMSRLLSIIQQRNDIISCLDLDRQREKEEDMMLSAVIQRTDLLTQTDKQLEKFNKKFKGLQMFKASGCKSKNSSRKKSS
ncbi:MICAL-like protein 1 isoform X3 [Megalobrama amblycephala]|uniref:MICAL-like protein 1 isoform X3 n=1 Tax=Megalobrama amblycephala TaxID=75352 RepID=UPI002013E2DC|nr:MICAL-like protein 1 isoform X3 [Megalobrama amblycephala]